MQLAMDNRSCTLRLRRREEVCSSVQLWRGLESREAFSMPATTVVAFDAFFSSPLGLTLNPPTCPAMASCPHPRQGHVGVRTAHPRGGGFQKWVAASDRPASSRGRVVISAG